MRAKTASNWKLANWQLETLCKNTKADSNEAAFAVASWFVILTLSLQKGEDLLLVQGATVHR